MAWICAGIADYYSGLDVAPVRVIVTVVSVFTGGTAVLAYLAAWLIIPRRRRENPRSPRHPRPEADRLIGPATAKPAAERNLDMDPTDPIRRVSAVSTGRVQIHPDHQAARLPALDRAPAHQRLRHRAPRGPSAVRCRAGPGLGPRPRLFPRRHDRGAVRPTGRPALMMAGDVTYDADLLELGHVPGPAAGAACGTPPP